MKRIGNILICLSFAFLMASAASAYAPIKFPATSSGDGGGGTNFTTDVPLLTITSMIGDNDGYGYGSGIVGDGSDLPITDDPYFGGGWLFDNRSAAEMSATNGSQSTDIEDNFDVTFIHEFNMSQFDYLTEAFFTIDISGLQQGIFGGFTHLYLDGTEVLDFLSINQQAWGSGLLTYAVDLDMISDGRLEVFVDNFDDQYSNDHIAIDFVKLTVTGAESAIPEPATMLLFGLGAAGLALRKKFRF